MDDIKLIFASNLIRLRTAAGMTQLELGEALNYTDKAVSKWERAESMPDVAAMVQIARLFHVTLDELVSPQETWRFPLTEKEEQKEKRRVSCSASPAPPPSSSSFCGWPPISSSGGSSSSCCPCFSPPG